METLEATLRQGLRQLREGYRREFYAKTSFPIQWQRLAIREEFGLDVDMDNKAMIENNFAWKSRKLLRKLQGD